jgi:Flp pilus assembly protein TadG
MVSKYMIKSRSIQGSILAEAALAIPLVVAALFFIIEFGNVLYLNNSVNQISRSAARYISVNSTYTNQDLINVSGAMNIVPNLERLTFTITPQSGAQVRVGDTITVTAQYNYTPIVNPYRLLFLNNSWTPTVRSVSVIRSEVSNAP